VLPNWLAIMGFETNLFFTKKSCNKKTNM